MKVLFITSTRIGDAVLSTSILNLIKNKFPYSNLYIAVGETSASLFKNFGNVKLDEVHIQSFDCRWNFASSVMNP